MNFTWRTEKIINFTATAIVAFYFAVVYMQQFLIIPQRLAQLLLILCGATGVLFIKEKGSNAWSVGFFLLYTLCGIASWVYNGNADLAEYLWIVSFGGMSLILLNCTINFNGIKYIYYVFLFMMDLLIVSYGNVDLLPMASSRNTISSFGIVLFSIYCIAAYQNRKKVSIIASLAFIITALLGIGRSGVLLAGIIFGACLIWDINVDTFKIKNPGYILVMAFGMLVAAVALYEKVIYPAIRNILWRGLISPDRIEIWRSYYGKVMSDPLNILFGASVSGNEWLDKYHSNLHNSFMNLHSKYGLIILILILILTCNAIFYLIKKRKMILLVPFLAVIFRAQTDYTDFNGISDIVWYYFMLLPFFGERSFRRNSDG